MKPITLIAALIALAASAQEEIKVYLKTDPAGAAVWDTLGDAQPKLMDKKTPAIFLLSKGQHALLFKLDGFKDEIVFFKAEGVGIVKADTVTLKKKEGTAPEDKPQAAAKAKQVDILFPDDGWSVMVDGKEAIDVAGKPAVAPCTVELEIGQHEITMKKAGYDVIAQKATVAAATESIEVKKQFKNKIVIWNGHNAGFNNQGASQISVSLFFNGRLVHKVENCPIDWRPNEDIEKTIDIPQNINFNKVRVDVLKWVGVAGCLSEIEVYENGRNIALGKSVSSSGCSPFKECEGSDKFINDGITSSSKKDIGYWACSYKKSWIEIDLSKDK